MMDWGGGEREKENGVELQGLDAELWPPGEARKPERRAGVEWEVVGAI